jgi:spore coat protein CotH
MEWEPVAVYINGEYWGFFDLREKINAEWFEQHEDIDSEDLSLLKGGGSVRQGSSDSYRELLNYIQNNDLSVQENYDHVAELMDVDNFTDYLLAEIFFANTDSGNIKFYVDESGGKWRWVLFDLDMSLRPSCVQKGGFNSIEEMFDPAGHGANNMFTTIIQRKLIQNEGFREKFISRYAELLNTYYQPENLLETFNSMVSRMDSEMVLHGARWEYPTYEKWLKNVDEMREILEVRRDVAKVQMIDFFDLSDDEVAELFPDDEPITDKNSVYLNASND